MLTIYEGEKIDKIKRHLKKHKGKYLVGAGLGALAYGAGSQAKDEGGEAYKNMTRKVEDAGGKTVAIAKDLAGVSTRAAKSIRGK